MIDTLFMWIKSFLVPFGLVAGGNTAMQLPNYSWSPFVFLGGLTFAVTLIVYIASRGYSSIRRSVVFLVTSGIILLTTLVLLSPTRRSETGQLALAALVDVSESMPPPVTDKALAQASALSPAQSFLFARRISPPGSLPTALDAARGSWSTVLDSNQTDLQSALSAAGTTPLLLVSDGWMTSGTEDALIQDATIRQLPIYPLIPPDAEPQSEEPSVALSGLYAPFYISAKTSAEVRTTIKNTTSAPQSGLFTLTDGTVTLAQKTVTLAPSSELPLVFQTDNTNEGIHELKAVFVPKDPTFGQSSRTIFITSAKREKILVLSGTSEESQILHNLLQSQAYDTVEVVAASQSGTIPPFLGFSSIVLNNVPASSLGPTRLTDLASFVKSGGGLIQIGGNRSYGLGGYKGTPIEPLLPVALVPPKAEQKRVSNAVLLVIDKSRSMNLQDRLLFAQEAAREVVRNLKDQDFLGVFGFDDTVFKVLPPTKLAGSRDLALDRISRLLPQKGSNLLAGLDAAGSAIQPLPAGRKHIIIVTDGLLPSDASVYIEACKQWHSQGITISTILAAGSDNSVLADMAKAGGGANYITQDPSALPRIFIQDLKVNTGEKTLHEETDFDVIWKGVPHPTTEIRQFPRIQGYVETLPREGAQLEITVEGPEGESPLLASWDVGKGHVVALTTDASGRWTSDWVTWPRLAQFWTDILTATRKNTDETSSIRYDLTTKSEYGSLVLELTVYSEKASRELSANLAINTGLPKQLALQMIAPGRFRAIISGPESGKYSLTPMVGDKSLPTSVFMIDTKAFTEQAHHGFNRRLLERLAAASGGKVNPSERDLASLRSVKTEIIPYSRQIFLLSLVLFLCRIVYRIRWPVST